MRLEPHTRPTALRLPAQRRSGFSIVEAILAVVILGIGAAVLVPTFATNAKLNTDAETRTGALAVAERVIDEFRQRPFSTWDTVADAQATPDTFDLSLDTGLRTYDVEVSWDVGDLTLGDGLNTRHLRVEVYLSGTRRAVLETVYTEFDAG